MEDLLYDLKVEADKAAHERAALKEQLAAISSVAFAAKAEARKYRMWTETLTGMVIGLAAVIHFIII